MQHLARLGTTDAKSGRSRPPIRTAQRSAGPGQLPSQRHPAQGDLSGFSCPRASAGQELRAHVTCPSRPFERVQQAVQTHWPGGRLRHFLRADDAASSQAGGRATSGGARGGCGNPCTSHDVTGCHSQPLSKHSIAASPLPFFRCATTTALVCPRAAHRSSKSIWVRGWCARAAS